MPGPTDTSPAPRHRLTPRSDAVRAVFFAALLAAIVALLVFARVIVVSLLVGVGIGAIVSPLLQRLKRRFRIPRGAAATLLVLVGIALIGALGWSLFAMVDTQAAALSERAPELIHRLQGIAQGWMARFPWLRHFVEQLDLAQSASGVGAIVFHGAWSGLAILSTLVFSIVIGIYVAVDADEYRTGLVRAFPARHRERVAQLARSAALTVRTWFRAQLVDMAIIGLLTSLGLWLVDADYWLLLGLVTAVFGIIPYVGIAIVVTFACLVTVASDPGRVPWVLGVFVATQQLEGHLILPLVMRGGASLPAVPLLVFMLLMGSWAGLLGVLIAPPLFAVLKLLYHELYQPRVDALALTVVEEAAPPAPRPDRVSDADPRPPAPAQPALRAVASTDGIGKP